MTEESQADSTEPNRTQEPYRTRPSIRPVVIFATVGALFGATILGYLFSQPAVTGNPQYTEIAIYFVAILTAIFLIRSALKIYLLSRLRYIVDENTIRTQYTLLYKTQVRELPLAKVRGTELNQSRLQTVLGFGDVRFLSGGTNQSLGFLEFVNVPHPTRVQKVIRDRNKSVEG